MGVRAADWSVGLSVQQQLMARMSVEVGYYRRWFNGFTLNDNRALENGDLTPYSITAPSDPRLPNGGGYRSDGLYDVVPAKAGQVDNMATLASKYGDWYQYFNGFDVTLNLRTASGITFQGGTSTGQNVADNCDVRANLPELTSVGAGWSARTQPHEPLLKRGVRWLTHSRPRLVPDPEDRDESAQFPRKRALRRPTTTCRPQRGADAWPLPSGNVPTLGQSVEQGRYRRIASQDRLQVAKILRCGTAPTVRGCLQRGERQRGADLQQTSCRTEWLQANSC